MIEDQALDGVPLLVLANKQDVEVGCRPILFPCPHPLPAAACGSIKAAARTHARGLSYVHGDARECTGGRSETEQD